MVGGKNLVGKVIEYRRRNYQLLNLDQVLWKPIFYVGAGIDGLFMATQYDIPWRKKEVPLL